MRDAIRERVMEFVRDLVASPARDDVLAVVVSGSAARQEERWVDGVLLSDIDVMVISRSSRLRLDRSRTVEAVIGRHLNHNIEGGRIPVSTLNYLTLANFEARHRGVVVYGDPDVLLRIPMEEPSQIPAWEAMRLVANRLFEHLKLRAGATREDAAVLKSYEAIAESQLVLEGRYRPTFHERTIEIEHSALHSPVTDAGAHYAAAEAIRRGASSSTLDASPSKALRDLHLQLTATMVALDLPGETLGQRFEALERREFHLAQRVYWTARGVGRADGRHRPTIDPILQVWKAGIRGLSGNITETESSALVLLWQQCPQIFKKGVSS